MTRRIFFCIALLTVLSLGLSNAFAQAPAAACVSVVGGDTLWTFDPNFNLDDLAGKNPQLHPALNDPSRLSDWRGIKNGRVLLKAGKDCLFGVFRSGDTLFPGARNADGSIAPKPVEDPAFAAAKAELKQAKADLAAASKTSTTLGWLLSAVLFAAVLLFLAWRRWKSQAKATERSFESYRESADWTLNYVRAATDERAEREGKEAVARAVAHVHDLYNPYSAPACVVGGVSPMEPERVEDALLREAYRELGLADHLPYEVARDSRLFYRIGRIEYGMMNGHVTVRGEVVPGTDSEDAKAIYEPKILRGQPGYRTRVRLHDGTERMVYSLARCCNPVRTGNWMEAADDFTFTPISRVAPAPVQPEPPLIQEEQTLEIITPAGGRLVLYGPGDIASVDGDLNLLVVTFVAPQPPAESEPKATESEQSPVVAQPTGSGGSGGSGLPHIL